MQRRHRETGRQHRAEQPDCLRDVGRLALASCLIANDAQQTTHNIRHAVSGLSRLRALTEKFASDVARRMSQAVTMSMPAPMQLLWMAATTGTGHSSNADMAACSCSKKARKAWRWRPSHAAWSLLVGACSSAIKESRSMPAQKFLPAPLSTICMGRNQPVASQGPPCQGPPEAATGRQRRRRCCQHPHRAGIHVDKLSQGFRYLGPHVFVDSVALVRPVQDERAHPVLYRDRYAIERHLDICAMS
jgi:hypothetical protein